MVKPYAGTNYDAELRYDAVMPTKWRRPFLEGHAQAAQEAAMAVAEEREAQITRFEVYPDHVSMSFSLNPNITVRAFVNLVKWAVQAAVLEADPAVKPATLTFWTSAYLVRSAGRGVPGSEEARFMDSLSVRQGDGGRG